MMGSLEVREELEMYAFVHFLLEGLRYHDLGFHWWPGTKWNRIACYLALGPYFHYIFLHVPGIHPYDTLSLNTFLFDWDSFTDELSSR